MTSLEIIALKTHNKIDESTCRIALEEVEQEIKNYCKIDRVPEELNFTAANMAVDLIRYEMAVVGENQEGLEDISLSDVSSIKIGDTSINLGSAEEHAATDVAKNSHRANLDEVLMNYKAQLNRFRRMVW